MWRNIFGHAIIQIIILNLIIFGGPHFLGLCQPYGTLCLHHNAKGECDSYNPFYATGLYQTDESIADWKAVESANFGVEKAGKWDTTALNLFRCHYQDLHAAKGATPCNPSDTTTIVSPYNGYTPKDMTSGDETQKIIHFTFVFQIFVFLQLFNQINARKIEEKELNVFSNFFSNAAFIIVWIIEWVTQISMV